MIVKGKNNKQFEIEVVGIDEDAYIHAAWNVDDDKEATESEIEWIQDNNPDVIYELANSNAQSAADFLYDSWKDRDA